MENKNSYRNRFKQWLDEAIETSETSVIRNNYDIEYEVGHRGGYITVRSGRVLELLNIPEKYLGLIPRKIGAGCNYLGGGVRGAVFSLSGAEYHKHGVPLVYALRLQRAGEVLKEKYIEMEDGMNNETYEDGDTNWDAMATNASRKAGTISAY